MSIRKSLVHELLLTAGDGANWGSYEGTNLDLPGASNNPLSPEDWDRLKVGDTAMLLPGGGGSVTTLTWCTSKGAGPNTATWRRILTQDATGAYDVQGSPFSGLPAPAVNTSPIRRQDFTTWAYSINANDQNLTGLPDPAIATQAANKRYVDLGDTVIPNASLSTETGTLENAHAGRMLRCTYNTGPITLTLPGSVANTLYGYVQAASSQPVLLAAGSGVTIEAMGPPSIFAVMPGGVVQWRKWDATTYVVWGDLYKDPEPIVLEDDLDADSYKIINLGTPTSAGDATNKTYVDTGDSNTLSSANTYALNLRRIQDIAQVGTASITIDNSYRGRYIRINGGGTSLQFDDTGMANGARGWLRNVSGLPRTFSVVSGAGFVMPTGKTFVMSPSGEVEWTYWASSRTFMLTGDLEPTPEFEIRGELWNPNVSGFTQTNIASVVLGGTGGAIQKVGNVFSVRLGVNAAPSTTSTQSSLLDLPLPSWVTLPSGWVRGSVDSALMSSPTISAVYTEIRAASPVPTLNLRFTSTTSSVREFQCYYQWAV